MTTQNLVLTEKAISRHTKRLIKELAKINHELKLSEAQNMLSRILGMNDYHELKKVLNFDTNVTVETTPTKVIEKDLAYYLNTQNLITVDYAQQNLEKFFADGSIDIIFKFLDSKDLEIQHYIEDNIFHFFNIAAKNNHVFLLKSLIDKKLINLHDFTEQQIKDFYFNLIAYNNNNLDSFHYIFYKLKFPQTLSQYLVGMITHYLATNTEIDNITHDLHVFLEDDRVSFQKDFFWNKTVIFVNKTLPNGQDSVSKEFDLSSCVLNVACARGNLDVVKYLINEQKLLPFENGYTVKCACSSGNIKLVKYLINDIKANFVYHKKNNHEKLNTKDLTYYLDYSTLSAAVTSGNLQLVKYLIDTKKLKVSDNDYLALRVALIESSSIYTYFMIMKECREYIQQHAQEIFDQVIYKIHYHNNKNYKQLQSNQYNIALALLSHYGVSVKEVVTVNDNPNLIQLLQAFFNILSPDFSLLTKSKNQHELLGDSQKTCVIISHGEVIRESLKLFLSNSNSNSNSNSVTHYHCYTFDNVNDYRHYISFNPQKIDLIICDTDMVLDNDITCPIVYLSEQSKEDVFYSLMCKLFLAGYLHEVIYDLKIYINLHLGQVNFKFWHLLLSACQKISNQSQFDRIAATFCHKFDLKEKFDFTTFIFEPENTTNQLLLSKPFSREDVNKIVSYISILY